MQTIEIGIFPIYIYIYISTSPYITVGPETPRPYLEPKLKPQSPAVTTRTEKLNPKTLNP